MTLLDAARAYQELMKYRYVFLLGHKGIAETLTLEFTKEAFHHLAGLHKIGIARIRNKKYALDFILESKDVPKIESRDVLIDRWECICRLKEMIESNRIVFRMQKREFPGSQIKADYLMTKETCIFFIKDNGPLSIFTARDDQLKNAARNLKLTILKIDREEINSGVIETLFVFKMGASKE